MSSNIEDIIKERMRYVEETNSCRNCEFFDRGQNLETDDQCTRNPAYAFSVNEHGICPHHDRSGG